MGETTERTIAEVD